MRPLVQKQDPGERLPYQVSVSGDVMKSAEWSIEPAGPTISEPQNRANVSTVFVSGVEEGTNYTLRCKITGTSGGEFVRSIEIQGAKQ